MRIERLEVGPLSTNCWLVFDEATGSALVIDPAAEPETILHALSGAPVSAVVLTHGHFDHLEAAAGILAASEVPLLVHAADAAALVDPQVNLSAVFSGDGFAAPAATRLLADGDAVTVGELTFRVLHTPGHTPGSICLLGGGELFSGDTLFASSVGRTDLPGGDGRALRDSIARALAPLPAETRVHPGHGPDTTIAREARLNPFWPRA